GNPRYVFWNTGTGKEQSAVTNWQHDLRALFRGTFGEDTDFTPHCLRDTFAVSLLEKGVPLEEVSKLLGHESIKTTEKSYAKWVQLDIFPANPGRDIQNVSFDGSIQV